MRSNNLKLSARYVFPVHQPPIENAILTIRDGKIAGIGPAKKGTAQVDLALGNVAITPGFVNAHTHLELSALATPQGVSTNDRQQASTENQVDWLKRVIQQRRDGGLDILSRNVELNLSASIKAGTTLLADTTTAGLSWDAINQAPVRAVVFAEVLGLKRERAMQTNEEAWTWISGLNSATLKQGRARPGLSPHAPYSTAGWLYQRCVVGNFPLSTHLAEMPEELELLQNRSGPLRTFLEDLGAWTDLWEPLGPSPADYLRKGDLRKADWLIAHGNYFQPSDFWQFRPEAAPKGQRVALVYCPRTHARFGHAPHPFRAMLERGIIVCLGTDSLASAPTLGILDEMRFLYKLDDTLPGELLLAMGTLFGAWALREEATTGTLEPGKSADLAIVELPDREEHDPYRLLFDSECPVVGTVFEGVVFSGRWAEV